jgi:hypothetical protein
MAETLHFYVPIVSKSGSLKLLEPSGLVQACNGIALPKTYDCEPLAVKIFSGACKKHEFLKLLPQGDSVREGL